MSNLENINERLAQLESDNRALRAVLEELSGYVLRLAESMTSSSESISVDQLVAMNDVRKALATAKINAEHDRWAAAERELTS